ncbi:hypothetical protein H0H93_004020 [Arthromyces matolae]|nr:hypothetical protein H0H93_004020 [Arthromyces matolae]
MLLNELPIEILLDSVLQSMAIPDILNLGCTNKFFASLSSDDTFWRRRLQADYNFSGAGTARTTGWKFIYRGLFNPRVIVHFTEVYVWGEKAQGRLGLSNFPRTGMRDGGVPFPIQLHIPGVRVVSLVAGGMSFHALDSEGQIFVWGLSYTSLHTERTDSYTVGALNGTSPSLHSDGFSEPGQIARTPLRLQMPAATRSISCGRLHASSMDAEGQIWTFPSWGRPFRLASDIFNDPASKPMQIECGWQFSSVLTVSGDVFIWWPFSGSTAETIEVINTQMNEQGDKKASPQADNSIPCVTWDLNENPTQLPLIPSLPEISDGESEDKPTQLIQIAGMDTQIVGLTNKGHVLKFGNLQSKATISNGRWEYLPQFSSIKNLVSQFHDLGPKSPETLKITHISANFNKFIAYSTGLSSVILIGDTDTTHESQPEIIPELQNKSIISVVLGDYHNAALTSTGKVFTWGAYSRGALGLGDPTDLPPGAAGGFETEAHRIRALDGRIIEPPAVDTPREVRFDHGVKSPKDRFCFAIAAAGWHTGALVIDLEPGEEEEELQFEPEDRPLPRHMYEQQHTLPGQTPLIPGFPGIRIGFAGRGGAFGRGSGRGRG